MLNPLRTAAPLKETVVHAPMQLWGVTHRQCIATSCQNLRIVYQPLGLGMMHPCCPGKSLARAEFMHHDDKRYCALKYYTALKGTTVYIHACSCMRYCRPQSCTFVRHSGDIVHRAYLRQPDTQTYNLILGTKVAVFDLV